MRKRRLLPLHRYFETPLPCLSILLRQSNRIIQVWISAVKVALTAVTQLATVALPEPPAAPKVAAYTLVGSAAVEGTPARQARPVTGNSCATPRA